MSLGRWLGALGMSGRALLASVFTAVVGVVSGFSVPRLAVRSKGPGKPASGACSSPVQHVQQQGATARLRAFPDSLFHELDHELTDADVRDLCWAVFSPSLLRTCSVRARSSCLRASM